MSDPLSFLCSVGGTQKHYECYIWDIWIDTAAQIRADLERLLCDILAELDTDSYPHHSDDPVVASSGHTSPVEAAEDDDDD